MCIGQDPVRKYRWDGDLRLHIMSCKTALVNKVTPGRHCEVDSLRTRTLATVYYRFAGF
jgi:hypothetical protein